MDTTRDEINDKLEMWMCALKTKQFKLSRSKTIYGISFWSSVKSDAKSSFQLSVSTLKFDEIN